MRLTNKKIKNPQEKSLYICRGSVHVPKYTYTLDSNKETKPSIIADITEPLHLTKYNNYFDKVVLENCPFYIYSIPYVNSKLVTNFNYLLTAYQRKKGSIHFKPNFQTFFNIYNLLKTNGLLYISNWGLIEIYTTEKDSKKIANNFVNDLEGMFKFNDIIKSTDQNLLKTVLVLKK